MSGDHLGPGQLVVLKLLRTYNQSEFERFYKALQKLMLDQGFDHSEWSLFTLKDNSRSWTYPEAHPVVRTERANKDKDKDYPKR